MNQHPHGNSNILGSKTKSKNQRENFDVFQNDLRNPVSDSGEEFLKWRIEKRQMHELIKRMSVQMAMYQSKLNIGFDEIADFKEMALNISSKIKNDRLVTYFEQDFDYLYPQLLSYDSTIKNLRNVISNYNDDVNLVRQKADRVIKENHSLRDELEKKSIELTKLYKNGIDGVVLGDTLLEIEKQDLQHRNKLLQEELTLVHDNLAIQINEKSSFDRFKTTMEDTLDKAITEKVAMEGFMTNKDQECELLKNDLIKLKHNNDEVSKSFERAKQELMGERAKTSELKNDASHYMEKFRLSDEESKVQKQDVDDKRNVFEDRIETLQDNERGLSAKINELQKSYDELRYLQADKDHKVIKYISENEELKLMVDRYDRDLQKLKKKDEENQDMINSMKSRVEELDMLRQEVNLNEKRRDKMIEEVRDGFKVENDTKKRKLEEKTSRLTAHKDLIEREKNEEINSLKQELNSIQIIADKQKRELELLTREKEQYMPIFMNDNKKDIELDTYKTELGRLRSEIQDQERLINDLNLTIQTGENNIKVKAWKIKAEEACKDRDKAAQEQRDERSENEKYRRKLDIQDKDDIAHNEELSTIRNFYEKKFDEIHLKNTQQVSGLTEQVKTLNNEKKVFKDSMNDQQNRHEDFEETLKNELEKAIHYYESTINEYKRDNQTLINRFQCLQQTVTAPNEVSY